MGIFGENEKRLSTLPAEQTSMIIIKKAVLI